MIEKRDFNKIKETYDIWLDEFLESDNAASFSSYQVDNIEKMLLDLFITARNEGVYPTNWTGASMVDLVVNHLCKTLPNEADFFEAYPETMSAFFHFLEEKGYQPNGKEIGQSLVLAKEDIHQPEEQRAQLEIALKYIQEAMDAGVDVSNPKNFKIFLEEKTYKNEVLNRFHDKSNAGIPIPKIMSEMSKLEQDIVMEDMMSEVSPIDFDEKEAQKGLKILEAELAKGKSIEEAVKKIPEYIMPQVLGLMKSKMGGEASSNNEMNPNRAYHPPVETIRRDKKIGRNEPCPCRSGKKYKRCCIKK